MDRPELKALIEQLSANPEGLGDVLLELVREQYGMVPFVHKVLARRPDVALPHVLNSRAVFDEGAILGPRVNELIATAVAAALRCDFCMQAHMEQALASGATSDELFQALLVAGAVCESSSFAHAFRVLTRIEERRHASESGSGAVKSP